MHSEHSTEKIKFTQPTYMFAKRQACVWLSKIYI
jgi:hypothetical protein